MVYGVLATVLEALILSKVSGRWELSTVLRAYGVRSTCHCPRNFIWSQHRWKLSTVLRANGVRSTCHCPRSCTCTMYMYYIIQILDPWCTLLSVYMYMYCTVTVVHVLYSNSTTCIVQYYIYCTVLHVLHALHNPDPWSRSLILDVLYCQCTCTCTCTVQ